MTKLTFDLAGSILTAEVTSLVMAGWTGRDEKALWHHIEELKELGVKPPASVPVFYPLAAARMTQANTIQCPAKADSGEVEYFLLKHQGDLYVGTGSDTRIGT